MPQPPSIRIGQGFDVHRFAEDRKLILGGVRIEHPLGLEGHSDADVLAHAIGDALLGAAGLGDLGHHFPDTDSRYKDADSLELLRAIAGMVRRNGWEIANVDATVVAQAPRIAPHVDAMRAKLGTAMGISHDAVGIKATTSEGLGFAGRGEGIAAMAVALIVRATRVE